MLSNVFAGQSHSGLCTNTVLDNWLGRQRRTSLMLRHRLSSSGERNFVQSPVQQVSLLSSLILGRWSIQLTASRSRSDTMCTRQYQRIETARTLPPSTPSLIDTCRGNISHFCTNSLYPKSMESLSDGEEGFYGPIKSLYQVVHYTFQTRQR
jgi:hypothetical protein